MINRFYFIFIFFISVSYTSEGGELFLVDHGIHTGIVIDQQQIKSSFPELNSLMKAKYYEFSFGEEPFFRESEHTYLGMLKALFWPTSSLVRVVPMNEDPMELARNKFGVAKIKLEQKKIDAISSQIKESFANFILIEHQTDSSRYFFRGKKNYHIFNNCNDWTAQIFDKAGFKSTLMGKFHAQTLFNEIVKNSDSFQFNKVGKEKYLKYLR